MNRFVEGPVIEDTTRLINYGVRLRNLLRDRSGSAFCHNHYGVKDSNYNISYPWGCKEGRSWFIDGELKEEIVPNVRDGGPNGEESRRSMST